MRELEQGRHICTPWWGMKKAGLRVTHPNRRFPCVTAKSNPQPSVAYASHTAVARPKSA